ncbi:TPA: hypothetical protein ACOAY7_002775 [Vibrio cholerae]|nr:hypothetical protein 2017DRC106_0370 [Vibrio phage ICP1]QVV97702.1 hypothetical protein 2017DRC32_0370 [Vibrio phage ICP1]QVV97929.1 hypothetical protein 2017DRC48_0370 [Vibrio phage ICP1]QVV98156.1 hypothetical protein 2017DRC55_0370 [Vibrio phage ICP1]QVV98382.1 hypothetical protein 2017DRC72_0365 [Vibrio phage ICP1]
MADIYLDPLTGDIDWGEEVRFTSEKEEYVQRLRLAWSLNLGEFFSHYNYGLPWIKDESSNQYQGLRYMLGDNTFPNPENFIKYTLDTYTESLPYVKSVDSKFEFNKSSRVFEYTATIETIAGAVVTLPAYNVDL